MLSKSLNWLAWTLLMFATLFFIFNNALHYFNLSSPVYAENGIRPFRTIFMIHITGGVVAILTGPWQFISANRAKYTRIHRLTGKIYLTSILISGLCALYLSVFHAILAQKAITFGLGLFFLAVAWLLTSSMAFWSIKKRNFEQHREWMIRSYVVTCGFTFFRVAFGVLGMAIKIDPGESLNISAWICWSVPLLITEFLLQRKRISNGSSG